jgi:3-oxoacyl-[acyl-carrier protein] reductase
MEITEIQDRHFESFQVGETASFVVEITRDDVTSFANLTGDHNPLHMDQAYAATTDYKKPIVHGLLVAAPISTLAGHLLPGKRCLLLEVSTKFLRPVFPGDRLTYDAIITHISLATRVLKVQVDVSNQEGTVVLKGAYVGQVLKDYEEGNKS